MSEAKLDSAHVPFSTTFFTTERPQIMGAVWDQCGAFGSCGVGFGAFFRTAPQRAVGRSVWVFLAPGRSAAKAPADECWISLDFLGFSRQNLDLSMGYRAFSGKNFSRALLPGVRSAGMGDRGLRMRKRRIVHRASLTWFLIFCNELSSGPLRFAAPIQKQLAIGETETLPMAPNIR